MYLADRTNGRVASVVVDCTECTVAKRGMREQKLLLTA